MALALIHSSICRPWRQYLSVRGLETLFTKIINRLHKTEVEQLFCISYVKRGLTSPCSVAAYTKTIPFELFSLEVTAGR